MTSRGPSTLGPGGLPVMIECKLFLDSSAFEVKVTSGVVTIAGQMEDLPAAENLLDAIWDVAGVVDIRDGLTYPDR